MGKVFLAYDPILGREVALKLILGGDSDLAARMLREARSQSRIEHPNVCRIFEAGQWEGRPYIVMPYIKGKTLDALAPGLSREQLVLLYSTLCEGLHEAHRMGLVHRDIKPQNILVEETEAGTWKPYIMDFGLVRDDTEPQMTATGLIMGTPAFMSPEQARGDGRVLDRRADVYSLGASLYQNLVGQAPFEGQPMDIVLKVLTEAPPSPRSLRPDIPKDLETIVNRAMEKVPDHRYPTARALGEDLIRFLNGESLVAKAVSRRERMWRWAKRNPRLATASALVVLLGMGTIAQGVYSIVRLRRQAQIVLHFGIAAERMENHLRTATLRPYHDTSIERQVVVRQLAALEEEMGRRGALAIGPGHFALGKGYAALGDFRQARRHFQAAWDADFQTPEVSHHLGRTLAKIVQMELLGLTGKAREATLTHLNPTLRLPAIQHLKRGQEANPMAGALALGLLAHLENQLDEALRQATVAQGLSTWNDEGWRLEGDTWLEKSRQAYQADRFPEASEGVAKALAAFNRAVEVAPSSALAYAGLGEVFRQKLNLEIEAGTPRTTSMEAGLAACEQASFLDAASPQPYSALGKLLLRWADTTTNPDPSFSARERQETLERALESLKTAAALESTAEAHANLVWAYGLQVENQLKQGLDPDKAYQGAVREAGAAFKLQPDNARAIHWLSVACEPYVDHLEKRGIDSVPSLRIILKHLEEAFLNHPTGEWARRITSLNLSIAQQEASRNLDPRGSLDKAWQAIGEWKRLDERAIVEPDDLASALKSLHAWFYYLDAKQQTQSPETIHAQTLRWRQALEASGSPLGKVFRIDQDFLSCLARRDSAGMKKAEVELKACISKLEPGLQMKARELLKRGHG
jgi:serine/threonine-protein kinase